MNNFVFAAILPHPPILLPEIGKEELKKAVNTQKAFQTIAARIKEDKVDTIIIITPHGEVGQVGVPVYTSHVFEGNFVSFGFPKLGFSLKGNTKLALAIVKAAQENNLGVFSCPETLMDHGLMVPLYYPVKAGFKGQIIPMGIAFRSLPELFNFGKVIGEVVGKSEGRIGIIASADMSHRLTPSAPNGYSPKGPEFDEKLVKLVTANDVKGILNFDQVLAEEAAQDSLWSIAMLLGALDGSGKKASVLSYEGPFGVGYMVAEFR